MNSSLASTHTPEITVPSFSITGLTPSFFILMGIPGLEEFHIWMAVPMSVMYAVTLLGNCLLLLSIASVLNLHKPMYIFISSLSCSDLVLSSCIFPKLLTLFYFKSGEISFSACLIQMFLIHTFSSVASAMLTAMAFDRYVAVCHPLRYFSILTNSLAINITIVSLARGVVLFIAMPLLTLKLPFCATRIAHSFCEHIAVAKLSCADITVNNLYGLIITLTIAAMDLPCIALSYIWILYEVLCLPCREGRFKAINTCTAHVCIMSMFYVPIFLSLGLHRFQHTLPHYVHILVANSYLLLPPMANPLIYGVKMKEVQQGVLEMFQMAKAKLLLSN